MLAIEKQSLKVLLVDDSEASLKLLSRLLTNANFETQCALSGEACLKALESFSADVILMDYNMPDMDGAECTKRIKANEKTATTPVIFVSAAKGNAHLIKAFDVGAADFIPKPFNFIELITRIKTQVELKRAREKLTTLNDKLVNLDKQKDEMLGVVSHDLKNPLAAIKSLAEMLIMEDEDWPEETQKEFIENILEASEYMQRLVEDLLEMNSIERGSISLKIEEFDWVSLAESVIHANLSNATRKGQTIRFVNESENIPFCSDKRVSFQILDNILSNAIKYSPPEKEIIVRLVVSQTDIVCDVIDQGPGFTEKDKEKLFSSFTKLSARPTGGESSTGLGLSIVKKLAQALQGNVWCESAPGKGATFSIQFPRVASNMELDHNKRIAAESADPNSELLPTAK